MKDKIDDISHISSDDLYCLSFESLGEIWNAPENDHWDIFLKDCVPSNPAAMVSVFTDQLAKAKIS